MKKVLNTVVNVIGWLILLLVFSSIGFATEKPGLAIPLYALFFILVFAGVYFFVSKQRHSQENVSSSHLIFNKILGVIALIAALMMPYFIFEKINLPASTVTMLILGVAVMIVIGFFSIRLINSAKDKLLPKIIGYLVLILLASVPAITAINFFLQYFNRPYDALGTSYWCIISVALLSWWGFALIGKRK